MTMWLSSRIDHVAIAVWDLERTYSGWRDRHGVGRVAGSAADREEFVSRQMTFANGAKLELVAPSLAPRKSFIDTFLARYGPGVHHLTLKVDDLAAALDILALEGIPVVDVDRVRAEWVEAFVSPSLTRGPIVQVAQTALTDEQFSRMHGNPVIPPRRGADEFHGVVIGHPDVDDAARIWASLGAVVGLDEHGVVCTWPGQPLAVWIRPLDHGQTGLVINRAGQPADPERPVVNWEAVP